MGVTETLLATVRDNARRGVSQGTIADLLTLRDGRALRRLFGTDERLRAAWSKGRAMDDAAIAETLYERALAPDAPPALLIFLAKTRLGLSERSAIELSGPGGRPLPTVTIEPDMSAEEARAAWEAVRDGRAEYDPEGAVRRRPDA